MIPSIYDKLQTSSDDSWLIVGDDPSLDPLVVEEFVGKVCSLAEACDTIKVPNLTICNSWSQLKLLKKQCLFSEVIAAPLVCKDAFDLEFFLRFKLDWIEKELSILPLSYDSALEQALSVLAIKGVERVYTIGVRPISLELYDKFGLNVKRLISYPFMYGTITDEV
jgi:hypothetical protein